MSNKYELNDEDLQNVTGGTGEYNFQLGAVVKISTRTANNQWNFKCNGRVTSAALPVIVRGDDGITYQGSNPNVKFEA